MDDDGSGRRGVTRREYVAGGTIAGGGLLAGCIGESSDEGSDDDGPSREESEPGESYEVCIEPTGCIELESVPERWAGYHIGEAEIGLALGVFDRLTGLAAGEQLPDQIEVYEQLLDTSIELHDVVPFWSDSGLDKEPFYEADAEIHLIDRNVVMDWDEWSEEDVAEIEENVGPFMGSFIRREQEFNEEYLCSLYEVIEKYAELFEREEHYEAFKTLHDETLGEVKTAVPDNGPEICRLFGGSEPENGVFYLGNPTERGSENKHYRDLGVRDAFEEFDRESGTATEIDYETLLDVDPEVIVYDGGLNQSGEEFVSERIEPMEAHPIGSELTAVQNGHVFPGGFIEVGPILNLFNTEMLARQLYSEEFGEFDLDAPFAVPEDERLFDRQEVAEIINGEI